MMTLVVYVYTMHTIRDEMKRDSIINQFALISNLALIKYEKRKTPTLIYSKQIDNFLHSALLVLFIYQ